MHTIVFFFDKNCCKCFESIQDIEAVTKRHSQKTSRTASESGKKNGVGVKQGGILKGINCNVSLTDIKFYLNAVFDLTS